MAFTIHHPEHGDITLSEMPLYGIERAMGVDPSLPAAERKVAFILKDDDDNVLYGGELDDDPDAENQSAALRYGEADEGATVIKVWRGDWVQEIG